MLPATVQFVTMAAYMWSKRQSTLSNILLVLSSGNGTFMSASATPNSSVLHIGKYSKFNIFWSHRLGVLTIL